MLPKKELLLVEQSLDRYWKSGYRHTFGTKSG